MIKQIKKPIISFLLSIVLIFQCGHYNLVYGNPIGTRLIAERVKIDESDVVENKSSIDEQNNKACTPEVSTNTVANIKEEKNNEEEVEEIKVESEKYLSGWISTESKVFEIPDINADILTTYEIATQIEYIEINSEWVKIKYEEDIGYVINENVVNEEPILEAEDYEGKVLNSYNGTVTGPGGKETYYNLSMDLVIQYMKNLGYDYNYWVREDGVKMYGDYIMIAANTHIYEKGTLIETSLGMGMVCDHCVAAEKEIDLIDIAVTW